MLPKENRVRVARSVWEFAYTLFRGLGRP